MDFPRIQSRKPHGSWQNRGNAFSAAMNLAMREGPRSTARDSGFDQEDMLFADLLRRDVADHAEYSFSEGRSGSLLLCSSWG